MNIKTDIDNALNPIKAEIDNLKKDLKSNPSAIKKLENIDSKIKKASSITITKTMEDFRIELYINNLTDLDDLKQHIKFFEWLKEEPRAYNEETQEVRRLTRTITLKRYIFPTSDIRLEFGIVPFISDHNKGILNFEKDKVTLSQMGLRLLEKMKEVLNKNSK
ncbi:hypothetical protein HYW20_01405 [Candidatus Woesearchaeota archaeon]|nr:hypothetical protein [Candidatus Woesearchaeota archaeon]